MHSSRRKNASYNESVNKMDVRNKGLAIQMPALNITLVEVHDELAKTTRAAKENHRSLQADHKGGPTNMDTEWSAAKKTNEELLTQTSTS